VNRILHELRQAWREWWCWNHWWRPCRYHLRPAKVCEDCGKTVPLTEEEFYAEFAIAFSVATQMPALEPLRKKAKL